MQYYNIYWKGAISIDIYRSNCQRNKNYLLFYRAWAPPMQYLQNRMNIYIFAARRAFSNNGLD